ncbi:Med12 domain-containing protein [Aphelenchoides fujianensis]|nr:Med12 domain-containing protein [Aphelenchoides fujianensis]
MAAPHCQQVFSVHTQSPEKRPLKRHRLGPADVFPQDPKQDEDNMSAERVKKGFQINMPACEHEGIVFVPRPRFIDDAMQKAALFTKAVIQLKVEHSVIHLDRKKLKEGTFQQFNSTQPPKAWFDDLAKGKSLQHLAKKIPQFRQKESCMEFLYQSKVPIQRALWYLKISQPESNPVYQRWPYFACLFKHAFEEGIVDRQEFLMELCDLLADHADFPLDRPQLFRILVTFTSQFVDVATQNVILARRLGHIVCSRLAKYKYDFDQKKGVLTNPTECFEELLSCQHHRAAMLTMLGILHALIVDCPAAFVFNITEPPDRADLKPNSITAQLCGSPLDQFPFPEEVLTRHFPASASKMTQILRMRLQEIRQRSRTVEMRWALSSSSQSGFEQVVDTCINVLSALDMTDVAEKNALLNVYHDVFTIRVQNKVELKKEMLLRLRMCFQWVITTEREGSHRALLVAQLLKKRIDLAAVKREPPFAGFHLQDVLIDFLTHDSPTPDSPAFRREYANMMHLFLELQHHGLFSHDLYVRALIRIGLLNQQLPVMQRVNRQIPVRSVQADDQESPMKSGLGGGPASVVQPTPPAPNAPQPQGDPAVISFVPLTVDQSPLPVLERPKDLDASPAKQRAPSGAAGRRREGRDFGHPDEHVLLDTPADISVHERFLIHVPIPQLPANLDACNQRAVVLYGMSAERENAKAEVLRAAAEISKVWQRRIFVQFFPNSNEVLFKRRTQQVPEAMAIFRQQTYHDQLVIVGHCVDSFMSMIYDYKETATYIFPTMESLDLLCGMMEECRDFHGLVELGLHTFHSDYVPGILCSQLAYVLCSYYSEHYDYFLLSNQAPKIVNALLDYFKYHVVGQHYVTNGWARAICIFLWHTRTKLRIADLTGGDPYKFSTIFPEPGFEYMHDADVKWNKLLFTDLLQEPRRFFAYHNYKLHLPSIADKVEQRKQLKTDDGARFSFVVNAFRAALEAGRDFEKLAELANICSHKSMELHWCTIIEEFCFSKADQFMQFLEYDREEMKWTVHRQHVSSLLLAAKYCFSVHSLINRLIQDVFLTIINDPNEINEKTEAGLCLTLRICAGLICARDEPFHVRVDERTSDLRPKKTFGYSADLRGLRLLQICEYDAVIFPLLSSICILNDLLMKRYSRQTDNALLAYTKCALLAMCEEEWVVKRVFWICETKTFEAFRCDQLRNVSQQLLQFALRRRSERKTKQELMVCNGNTKKSMLEKLFTSMNLWNFRATYYDLLLMIRENSPDSRANPQQSALAGVLFTEIGRCCRDIFLKSKQNPHLLQAPALPDFKLSHINCYWLLAPLIRACPTPDNVPNNIQASFIKEAAVMLETSRGMFDSNFDALPSEVIQAQSTQSGAWLLSQQPFIDLILACVASEEGDELISALLKQFQELVQRVKESPSLPSRFVFTFEREGLLLRLSLIGGIFDSLMKLNAEPLANWALTLFQLLFYGVLSPERDREYFDACYDMLSMILHRTLIPAQAASNSDARESNRARFTTYNAIVKKIKKELGDRPIPPDLHCLAQLLPVPKSLAEQTAWDSFSAQSPQKSRANQPAAAATSPQRPNQPPLTAPPEMEIDHHLLEDRKAQMQQQLPMSQQQQQQQKQMFSPASMPPNNPQQMPPTPATPSERPIVPQMMHTPQSQPPAPSSSMSVGQSLQSGPQFMNAGMGGPPQQQMQGPRGGAGPQMPPGMNRMAMNQGGGPMMPQGGHPGGFPHQQPMGGEGMNPAMMAGNNQQQIRAMMAARQQMQQQQQQMGQQPPAGLPRRSRRRWRCRPPRSASNTNAGAPANARGQKRKKADSKTNVFAGGPLDQQPPMGGGMPHPSTANFPHAPPSSGHGHQLMHPHPSQMAAHQPPPSMQQQMQWQQQQQQHQMRAMGGGMPGGPMGGGPGDLEDAKPKTHADVLQKLQHSIANQNQMRRMSKNP